MSAPLGVVTQTMRPLPVPFRGEVWDVDSPDFGEHPAIVLSVNALNSRLGHVAVIPVTGTRGPALTHVSLDADAGLTRYDETFADVAGLLPVARAGLLRVRGRLTEGELRRLSAQLSVYLGLAASSPGR